MKSSFIIWFFLFIASFTSFSQQRPVEPLQVLNEGIVSIAERSNPAVVTIFTEKTIKQLQYNPFAPLFGMDSRPREREYTQSGLGSGVIVSDNGYVLTNNHVVGDADKIYVQLMNQDTLSAKVIGTDPNTDVAVIKISGGDFPTIPLGDSEKLRVGEIVFAIGSPLSENLNHTVTMGIVSAKGRSDVNITQIEDFIQTDAAINPGNSGGALVNIRGELIGINTAIASRSGGNQGIGFAIPINMAKVVMNSIIENGRVIRSFLGVSGLADVNEKYAKALGLKRAEGIIIGEVLEGTAAEEAGLKNGDVILGLNGKPVESVGKFQSTIYSIPPGSRIRLRINRDGKESNVTAILGEFDENPEILTEDRSSLQQQLGFVADNLSPEDRNELGLGNTASGIIVREVDRSRMAFSEGLRAGDRIVSINRTPVESLSDLEKRISDIDKGEYVLLRVLRGRNAFYIPLRLGY